MSDLKQTLGLPSLLFYGVGVIVGAGIYSVIGAAAEVARNAVWMSFVLAAVPASLAALCYAELCSMFPKAGAEYVYLRHAIPKWPSVSFATGFIVLVTGAATAATVAIAFAGYLRLFIPVSGWIAALALLLVCCGVNILGIKTSAWVTAVATLIEIGGLVMIIVAGMNAADFGNQLLTDLSPGVFTGAALIFFVYTGFEGLANLAEESEAPRRNLPLALLISVGITTVVYILVAVAVVALVKPEELANSESPLSTAGGAAAPWMATALGWIALFATGNTALITSVVASRLMFSMARSGDLPPAWARTLPKRKSPWIAALIVLGAASVLIPLGRIAIVASLSSFATLAAFIAVSVALIVLRLREPNRDRPFRVPLSWGKLPLLPVLLILSVLALMTQFDVTVYIAGAVCALIGFTVYHIRGRASKKRRLTI